MRICMFGASSEEVDQKYKDAAYRLGQLMAKKGIGLVFGGGNEGLMGAAARGAYSMGGEIIGVSPAFFDDGKTLYKNCTELIITNTMRERKHKMEELSDGFIVAPGGIGTFEEMFEVATLKQLGRLDKPIVLMDTDGFYEKLIVFMEEVLAKKFMSANNITLIGDAPTPEECIDYIESYVSDGRPYKLWAGRTAELRKKEQEEKL